MSIVRKWGRKPAYSLSKSAPIAAANIFSFSFVMRLLTHTLGCAPGITAATGVPCSLNSKHIFS